jgi:hypothetical protein
MENSVIHQDREGEKRDYWSEDYHINAYVSLGTLVYSEMNAKTFEKIKQPLFLGYYYKSAKEQDFVVSVPQMKEMYEQVGTPADLKREQAFPKAGDHVIGSSITSQDWEGVMFSTIDFLENVAKVPARPEFQREVDEISLAEEVVGQILEK